MPFYLASFIHKWPARTIAFFVPLLCISGCCMVLYHRLNREIDWSAGSLPTYFPTNDMLHAIMMVAWLWVVIEPIVCAALATRHLSRSGFAICRECAYPLPQRMHGICPECGRVFRWDEEVKSWRSALRTSGLLLRKKPQRRAEANTPAPPEEA